MSFASDVKEELAGVTGQSRHCQIAELFGILLFSSCIMISARGEYQVRISSENGPLVKKASALLRKICHIQCEAAVREGRRARLYLVAVTNHEEAVRVLKTVRLLDKNDGIIEEIGPDSLLVLQKECCRKSFLRGAYLASGAMSNPENSYHLEIVCGDSDKADLIQKMMTNMSIPARRVIRKGNELVYIKEGDAIVSFLGATGAVISLMEFENLRILKDMRNNINRKVNCEAANISKTVSAAVKQLEDIEIVDRSIGLDSLSPALREIAELRRNYPDATLVELGEMMDPPVGKSGINHRLRKLAELADKYR